MKKRIFLITCTFSLSFITMGILSLFSVKKLYTYIDYSNLMDHSGFVIEKIYSIEQGIRDLDRTERGYTVTKDTMFQRLANTAIDTLYKSVAELKSLTLENAKLQRNIVLLNATIANRIYALRFNMNYVDTCDPAKVAKHFYDSRSMMLECAKLLKSIHDAEDILKEERYKEEQFYEKITTNSITWLLVIFFCITVLLFFQLAKELKGRIHYQEELQARVVDLQRSHGELQEIAYAASHDLQEPLRKIQVFSNMLIYFKNDRSVDEYLENLKKINNSAKRMQSLITDLMSLTSLTKIDEAKKEINLNRMLKFIISNMEERIAEKSGAVVVKLLPIISGYENQLKILFNALLDNALKFSRKGISPVITISCDIVLGHELNDINVSMEHKKFHCICVSDNGIGFEKQFIAKMFQIFQRLHHVEDGYDGKGIGLAICRRVMANHEGYILASGAPDIGATFKLFFPLEG